MANQESETIRVEQIAIGDIIHVYNTTFRVDHLHDISMAREPHHHIHIEGERLSNSSRVGLNLYALDTVERISTPVACDDCCEPFPASALYGDGLCAACGAAADLAFAQKLASETTDKFTERDEAPLVKAQPKGVKVDGWDV